MDVNCVHMYIFNHYVKRIRLTVIIFLSFSFGKHSVWPFYFSFRIQERGSPIVTLLCTIQFLSDTLPLFFWISLLNKQLNLRYLTQGINLIINVITATWQCGIPDRCYPLSTCRTLCHDKIKTSWFTFQYFYNYM